ncbi:prepilin peptidase [Saccharibacillus sp. O16]|nr:prepilin peptidase [Saccharibacillus sp. O16]
MIGIWAYIGCGLFLVAAFATDVRSRKIPNRLNLMFVLSGLLFNGVVGGWEGLLFALKGGAVGFGVLFVLYVLGAVGAGDVKLFAGIGVWTGIGFTTQTLLYSILFAGVIGLGILIWRRQGVIRMRALFGSLTAAFFTRSMGPIAVERARHLTFPFMWAVLPGAIAGYFYWI